ncbi:MAG: LamG domain-containing protein, partial [Deltaproteobacteria bacterium]|nr:LamG domain-containing protein [Deltaproteobacteria bacterium]
MNDQIMVRQTSSASNLTVTTATLTLGEVNGAFNVTTAAADDPNAIGLVSWWKAEDNAYDSLGGNHGTLQGGTTYAASKDGQAFNLNGVSQYLQKIDPVAIPVGNSSRTLSAWIRSDGPTDGTKYQTIVGYGTPWTNSQTFLLEWGGAGNDRHLYLTGWNIDLAGTSTLEYGQWYHVAVTYNGTTVTLYVNGFLDASADCALNTILNPDGLLIGTSPPNDGWHSYFNGRIDNVAVYNRALSASEVAKLAGVAPDAFSFTAQTGMPVSTQIISNPITVTGTSSPSTISITNGEYSISTDGGGTWSAYSSTIPATVSLNDQVRVRQTSSGSNSTLTTATLIIGGVSGAFNVTTAASGDPNAIGLVAWWRAENNVYDSIGTNNGTLQNGTTYASGKVGQSFSLDGINNYVEIPHDATLSVDPSSPMSFETWIYRTSTSAAQHIFSKRTDCSYFNYQLALDTL